MSRTTIQIDEALNDYLRDISVRETEVMSDLRERTAEMEAANMQISSEQGALMTLLVELMGVGRAVEIGTFTGYSALCIARAMPDDGELICCDVDEEWTSIAQDYWKEAGLDDRIRLELRPALETLEALIDDRQAESFDFAFVDADKENYVDYYDRCMTLVRPGGLLAFDNVLWGGSVVDPEDDDASTRAIRRLNETIADDARVTPSMVPIGDGLLLARKR
jgi:predicted O-methyltransferase YrrM